MYVAMMLAYSLWLKDVAIVDVLVLAFGYTLRIVAGALAAGLDVSPWLLVSSMALFFGLALLKRYAELVTLRPGLGPQGRVRGYRVTDANLILTLGVACACISVALLALLPVVESMTHARRAAWLFCAMLIYWIGHMWLMAHRGQIKEDPVTYALKDPTSQAFAASTAALLLLVR